MGSVENFEEVESRLGLGSSIILGVRWWELVRYNFALSHTNSNRKTVLNLSKTWRLSASIMRIPAILRRVDVVILRHPRFKLEEGKFSDIYTFDLQKDIKSRDLEILIIENPTPQKRALENGVYPLDGIKVISSFMSGFLSKALVNYITLFDVGEAIKSYGERNLTPSMILKEVLRFKIEVFFYQIIFKITNPKLVFVVVNQGNEALIYAGKKTGIKIAELQHGSPARGKMNYDYSNLDSRSYGPDFFLSFGRFFTKHAPLASSTKIVDFGFPYLEKRKSKRCYSEKGKIKFDFLILSQPEVDYRLIEFTKELLSSCGNEIKILVQEHPQYYSKASPYFVFSDDTRVVIKPSIESSLYDALETCRTAVTVYSTSIFEAYYFGLKCIVLDDHRHFLREFCLEFNVPVVSDSLGISDVLLALNRQQGDRTYLFSRYDEKVLLEVLNSVGLAPS